MNLHEIIKEQGKNIDELLNGMSPKVSNFGSFQDEEAKNRLQQILSAWWKEADYFYRDPIKSFLHQSSISLLQSIIEKLKGKITKLEEKEKGFKNSPVGSQADAIMRECMGGIKALQDQIEWLEGEIKEITL